MTDAQYTGRRLAQLTADVNMLKRLLSETGRDLVALADDYSGNPYVLRMRVKDMGERLVNQD